MKKGISTTPIIIKVSTVKSRLLYPCLVDQYLEAVMKPVIKKGTHSPKVIARNLCMTFCSPPSTSTSSSSSAAAYLESMMKSTQQSIRPMPARNLRLSLSLKRKKKSRGMYTQYTENMEVIRP